MNEKRISANQQNALRSTGPRSQAGKARSRLNATKHGGYAMVCIEGENDRRLKDLYLHLVVEYRPMGFEENLLVREISKTIWRKNRFQTAEAKAIDAFSYAHFEGEEKKGDVGLALAQDAGAYGTIPRCLAADEMLDRRLWRLFDRLRKRQKKRGFCPWKSRADSPGTGVAGTPAQGSPAAPVSAALSAPGARPATRDGDDPQS